MNDSKPARFRTLVIGGTLALAVVVGAATQGMGLWAHSRTADGALASGTAQSSGAPAGQRAGQAPRPPQVGDILPPARWRWWRDAVVQKEVGLSIDQVERLDKIVMDREKEMMPFIKEYLARRDELRRIAGERKMSTEEFAIHAATFEALDAKLNESRTIMLYRMSRELSDEQYKKLQEVRDRRSRGGNRGGSPNR